MPVPDPTASAVYAIRCIANNKVYIGSAVNLSQRWKAHRSLLARGKHHSIKLQRAWKKHGAHLFRFEILQLVSDQLDLVRIEQEWIDRLRSFDSANGYNMAPLAGSVRGIKHTAESRFKMSVAKKGKLLSREHRGKLSDAQKNRVRDPGIGNKISVAKKGKKLSLEHCDKLSKSHQGHRPTAETRAKMSDTRKGRVVRRRPAKNQATLDFDD